MGASGPRRVRRAVRTRGTGGVVKPHIKLRLVPRPLAKLSRAEKLANAIAWLRARNRYVMDANSRRPSWGIPFDAQPETPLMRAVMDADRRRK